jgi:excinuclease UvrABC nuclease subunit
MKELKDFEISEFGKPSRPGLYAVWCRNLYGIAGDVHLIYIGSTNNLYARLSNRSHPYLLAYNNLKNKMVWVSFYDKEMESLLDNEKYLIKKHKPIMNKQWR